MSGEEMEGRSVGRDLMQNEGYLETHSIVWAAEEGKCFSLLSPKIISYWACRAENCKWYLWSNINLDLNTNFDIFFGSPTMVKIVLPNLVTIIVLSGALDIPGL